MDGELLTTKNRVIFHYTCDICFIYASLYLREDVRIDSTVLYTGQITCRSGINVFVIHVVQKC